jgi:hypothetical protein
MKKMVAILIGLLASALLIGVTLAQTEDDDGANVAVPAYQLCGDFVQPTTSENMGLLSSSSTIDAVKCGKNLVRSPGDVLNLIAPTGNDLIYSWNVYYKNTMIASGDKQKFSWTVPQDACLASYTITLVVTNEDLAKCMDSCQIKVSIDCKCPNLNLELCRDIADPSKDTRTTVTYDWEGHGHAQWFIAGHLYAMDKNPVSFDWKTKKAGIYAVAMFVYSDDPTCTCGFQLPIKVCVGLVKIVDAPVAAITTTT